MTIGVLRSRVASSALGVLLAAGASAAQLSAPSAGPAHEASHLPTHDNVLLLIADDIALEHIGAFAAPGLSGPTPIIDRLAAHGVRFSRAYSNPLCSPTRATILTGLYGFRTGIGTNVDFHNESEFELRRSEFTLPEALAATHRTAAIGKWHLAVQHGYAEQHPIVTGFDFFSGIPGQLGGMHTPTSIYFDWEKTVASPEGNHQLQVQAYTTTEQVDDALAAIETFGDAPWFLYLAFNAPHTPMHAPPEELTTLDVDDNSPELLLHHAMVEAMDTEIGRLLASIPPEVMARTWVIFVGDNGSHGFVMSDRTYRGRAKSTGYEAGVHIPLIIDGPGLADGGRDVAAPANTTDLFATVLDMAGVELSVDRQPVDSVSLMPYLRDATQPPIREAAFAETFSPNGLGQPRSFMRTLIGARYKLIVIQRPSSSPAVVMFDLQKDPLEHENLLLGELSPASQAGYAKLAGSLKVLLGPSKAEGLSER